MATIPLPIKEPHVSISQIKTYKNCPYSWYLKYEERLSPKTEKSYFGLGSAVHAGMEAFWLAWHMIQDDPEDFADDLWLQTHIEEGIREYIQKEHVPEEGVWVDGEYYPAEDNTYELLVDASSIVWRTVEPIYRNYRVLSYLSQPMVEFPLDVSLDYYGFDGLSFRGKVDLVAENLVTGHVELIDWKTTSRYMGEVDAYMSEQLPIYAYMINYITSGEVSPSAISYYQIASSTPQPPKTLKKGGLSVDKRTSATWELYMDTAMKHVADDPNFNLDDYVENPSYLWDDVAEYYGETQGMKAACDGREWSRPLFSLITEETQEIYWLSFLEAVQSLEVMYKVNLFPRRLDNFVCQRCPFQTICIAETRGFDGVLAREMGYNVKPLTSEIKSDTLEEDQGEIDEDN